MINPAPCRSQTRSPLHAAGIGRVDIVESRFVGMKSRGVYETPGGTVLLTARRAIESICLDRGEAHLKAGARQQSPPRCAHAPPRRTACCCFHPLPPCERSARPPACLHLYRHRSKARVEARCARVGPLDHISVTSGRTVTAACVIGASTHLLTHHPTPTTLQDDLMPRYAELVYNGFWFSPERLALQEAIDKTQKFVTGTVRLKLYKVRGVRGGQRAQARPPAPARPVCRPCAGAGARARSSWGWAPAAAAPIVSAPMAFLLGMSV